MPASFRYADLHCHPNLKTFGHSFDRKPNGRSDMWHTTPPGWYTCQVYQHTGITKFSQTDFTTMTHGGGRIAFVSLYPFEKGFFINPKVWPPLAALLADWGIEIGYERIRYLQQHTDYFQDLNREYQFVLQSRKAHQVSGQPAQWMLTRNWTEVNTAINQENTIAVVLTIEGAHVFNTGLDDYGVTYSEESILSNIKAVKQWEYPPLFIGLAHNFNNDLCGHARSLQRLGKLVNQEKNIDAGIFPLGFRVIDALLDSTNGRRIYIDLKHMSLQSRLGYYQLLQTQYGSQNIPLIVSHGAANGRSLTAKGLDTNHEIPFNPTDLNFFDEELVTLARSGGLFALQMDASINTDPEQFKTLLKSSNHQPPIRTSARIIWNQLQHIATVCNRNGLFGWGCTAIGSDFDGSITPFPGLLTAAGLEPLSRELVALADNFLKRGILATALNRQITAEEIVERFMFSNAQSFLQQHYY